MAVATLVNRVFLKKMYGRFAGENIGRNAEVAVRRGSTIRDAFFFHQITPTKSVPGATILPQTPQNQHINKAQKILHRVLPGEQEAVLVLEN